MQDLKELYYYDESSPTCLRWNKDIFSGRYMNQKNVGKGDVAGGFSSGSGYYQVRNYGKLFLVHRVIWELENGPIPDGMFVDHMDQDKLNNRLENLRLVTRAGNNQNQPLRKDSTSGVVGVNFNTNTNRSGSISHHWRAVWFENGKVKSKAFNVRKYGYEGAFKLACAHRENMIRQLNSKGADYTELHGKGLD